MPNRNALKKEKLHMNDSLSPKTSAHEVDFGTYTHDGDNYTAWITKLNKHEGIKGEEASVLEVAFSEVALLFIKPGLTPRTHIVMDGQKVAGVASENFNLQIKKQIDQGIDCYSFDPTEWTFKQLPRVVIPEQEKIDEQRKKLEERTPDLEPITDKAIAGRIRLEETQKAVHFLDKMPKNFFVDLIAKHKNGDIVIDMESLASILTTSYVLEEDDLHKGNIGFYVTDAKDTEGNTIKDERGNPKKQFHFFKIDHDLMFIDSIMSQKDMRIANVFYNNNSFKISTRDLDDFPDLKDSGNHYWPTRKRIVAAGDKAYSNKAEREAFASLKTDQAFADAKWKYFFKSAIMPVALIEKSLTSHLDTKNDIDKINMVKNSIWFRLGKLKGKMLESEQFRDYIAKNGERAFAEIRQEIGDYLKNSEMTEAEQSSLMTELDDNFKLMVYCAKDKNLPKKEQMVSAMQQSILLGSYDFSSVNTPTKRDIKVALDQFKQCNKNGVVDAPRFTAACVAIDVIQKSGNKRRYVQDLVELQKVKNDYLKPQEIKSLKDFEAAADKIRAANLPLKQQKNEILAVLKEARLPLKDLEALKKDLKKREPDSPSLKFINQLRDSLWIVRKIYGTYGKTTTASMMINEIDAKIAKECCTKTKSFKDKHFNEIRRNTVTDNTRSTLKSSM